MARVRLAWLLLVAAAAPLGTWAFLPGSPSPQQRLDTAFKAVLEAAASIAAATQESPLVTRDAASADAPGRSAATPRRPRVPGRFVAPTTVEQTSLGISIKERGDFAYALDKKATRMDMSLVISEVSKLNVSARVTSVQLDARAFQITGGSKDPVCRVWRTSQGFNDQFSWAANPQLSTFAGLRSVGGRACALWRMRGGAAVDVSLCADGDAPVQFTANVSASHGGPFSTTITFGNFSAVGHDVDLRQFDEPATCGSLAPPCAGGRGLEPTSVDVYVFHPGMSTEDYDIADQDVADLVGDAWFICVDLLNPARNRSWADHNYTRISRYSLLVSPAFGQYMMCNGYPDTKPPGPVCFGGDPRLVGREAPMFMGEGELRCAASSPIGFWYSLPRAGQCLPGKSPGPDSWRGGCTWSIQRRLKTLDQGCLLQTHRLLDKCAADVRDGLGFSRSVSALQLAFASKNASAGGCPDIGGPDAGPGAAVIV